MQERTAVNPQTGERVVLRGGQWVPMGAAPSQSPQRQPISTGQDPRVQIAQSQERRAQQQFEQQQQDRARESQMPTLTVAEEAVDKEFAKEYVDWNANGGFADFRKQADQLNGAIELLRTDGTVSGGIVGRLPDSVNQFFGNDEAISVREDIEEVVQRNLRLILGAQFTEKEGDRLISRAYNPALDESINRERVERLLKQMTEAARAKESASRYFRENGTLKGWGGKLPTISDFNPEGGSQQTSDEDLIRKYLD